MRLSRLFFGLALVSPFAATSASESDVEYTEFNGEEVPPMLHIVGPELEDTIAKGNW